MTLSSCHRGGMPGMSWHGLNRCHLEVEKESSPLSKVNLPKMRTAFLSLYLLSRSLMTFGVTVATRTSASSQACTSIQAALPGKVFYPGPCPTLPQGPNTYLPISLATGSETYSEDIAHSTSSAEQNATCAVNPSSVDELSTIVRRFFCPFKRSDHIECFPDQDNRTRRYPCTFCCQFPNFLSVPDVTHELCRSKAEDMHSTRGSVRPPASK